MNVIMKENPKRTWDLEMIYKCDESDYEGKSKINIKAHVKQKHIGIPYSCGECDYQGSSRENLKSYNFESHTNVTYVIIREVRKIT